MAARTFYGDPQDPLEELLWGSDDDVPPQDGDELCDGHQAHYVWEGDWWKGWTKPPEKG